MLSSGDSASNLICSIENKSIEQTNFYVRLSIENNQPLVEHQVHRIEESFATPLYVYCYALTINNKVQTIVYTIAARQAKLDLTTIT